MGDGLDDLLDRNDIDAVIIALPVLVQPEVIKRAITAGKHVLSEKPVAKDVETAEQLIRWYKESDFEAIWSVGENFRFLESLALGADQVRKLGGEVVTMGVKMYGLIEEDDQYHRSAWRQDPKYRGRFLLHGGIEFVAGLRYLLAAGRQQITNVTAFTSLLQEHLAPVDTVHAAVQISNGNNGTFSLSFGIVCKRGFEIHVVTEKGAVTVTPTNVTVSSIDLNRAQTLQLKECKGIRQEVAAFAQSIKTGKVDRRGAPEQALMDLKVIQAMIESGEAAGKMQTV